jgi:hypothetical protein
VLPRKLDPAQQQAFIKAYDDLHNNLDDDEAVTFADAVHPTRCGRRTVGRQKTPKLRLHKNSCGSLREDVPKNWATFCDAVTDNFRIINPVDYRILKA